MSNQKTTTLNNCSIVINVTNLLNAFPKKQKKTRVAKFLLKCLGKVARCVITTLLWLAITNDSSLANRLRSLIKPSHASFITRAKAHPDNNLIRAGDYISLLLLTTRRVRSAMILVLWADWVFPMLDRRCSRCRLVHLIWLMLYEDVWRRLLIPLLIGY